VATRYYKVAVLLRQAQEQKDAESYVDGHIRDIENLGSSGLDVALDLLRARSQRRSLDLAANARDAELEGNLAALRSETGLKLEMPDISMDFDAAIQEEAVLSESAVDGSLQAHLNRLDLEAAQRTYQNSASINAPTLHLGLDHNFQFVDPATPVDRAYASLSLDALSWLQKGQDLDQHRRELEAQQASAQDQGRLMRLQAQTMLGEISHAKKAYAISVDLVKDAQKAMEISKLYYQQGKLKESDLLSVFADYLAARDQRDQALLDVLGKQAEWGALWQEAR
jgi:outer membrane protein TolC